jgi:hypothetical protein
LKLAPRTKINRGYSTQQNETKGKTQPTNIIKSVSWENMGGIIAVLLPQRNFKNQTEEM